MRDKQLTLQTALQEPALRLKLSPTDDVHQIELMLANAGNSRMRINCLGGILQPDLNAHQRLFVVGARVRDSDTIFLEPRSQQTVRLATVCMDQGKEPPVLGVNYRLVDEVPADHLLEGAKEWRRKQARNDTQGCLPEELDRDEALESMQKVAWS